MPGGGRQALAVHFLAKDIAPIASTVVEMRLDRENKRKYSLHPVWEVQMYHN